MWGTTGCGRSTSISNPCILPKLWTLLDPETKRVLIFFLLLQIEPEEVEKRAAFLRGQRDKLLAMKRAEREKQLEAATPQARPKSARAARNALGRGAFRQEIDPR